MCMLVAMHRASACPQILCPLACSSTGSRILENVLQKLGDDEPHSDQKTAKEIHQVRNRSRCCVNQGALTPRSSGADSSCLVPIEVRSTVRSCEPCERRLQMLQRVTTAVVDNLGDCITDRCGSHVARRLLSVAAGRAVGPAAVRKPKSTLFEDEQAEQPAPQVRAQPPDTS